MSKPVFRNPDLFQQLPFRDWLRDNLPSGNEGVVVEDLDLVLRVFGKNFHTDSKGKFMLIELKYGNKGLTVAQRFTFGLIDRLLRNADPAKERYKGYYLIQYTDNDWNKAKFKINGLKVDTDELIKFFTFDDATMLKIMPVFK